MPFTIDLTIAVSCSSREAGEFMSEANRQRPTDGQASSMPGTIERIDRQLALLSWRICILPGIFKLFISDVLEKLMTLDRFPHLDNLRVISS